jgi:hypothetical protein
MSHDLFAAIRGGLKDVDLEGNIHIGTYTIGYSRAKSGASH